MDKTKGRMQRKAVVHQERLIRNAEIFRQFTKGYMAPPPLTGHLAGGIDQERMKQIKEEIENREAARPSHGNGADVEDFRA